MRTPIAKLVAITALTVISVISARYALADYYFDRAKRSYEALNHSTLVYSHELDPILADINRSLTLRAASSKSIDLKADLLYQSWLLSPDGQYFDQSLLLQSAAEMHIDALSLRKNWAFSTSRLALIYSHQATLDANFEQWFSEAHRLGLYETSVARSLMIVGLEKWQQLTAAQRTLTRDFIATSIEQKANNLKAIRLLLDRHGQLEEMCQILTRTPRATTVCEFETK